MSDSQEALLDETLEGPVVAFVDDDTAILDSWKFLAAAAGFKPICYSSAIEVLENPIASIDCLVVDVHMPQMSGLDLLTELDKRHIKVPVIVITGEGSIPLAVRAIKAGAFDFFEKPVDGDRLLACIERALAFENSTRAPSLLRRESRFQDLTEREREVLAILAQGHPNKFVANCLGISPRTVETHRARIFEKLGVSSLASLIKLLMSSTPMLLICNWCASIQWALDAEASPMGAYFSQG